MDFARYCFSKSFNNDNNSVFFVVRVSSDSAIAFFDLERCFFNKNNNKARTMRTITKTRTIIVMFNGASVGLYKRIRIALFTSDAYNRCSPWKRSRSL